MACHSHHNHSQSSHITSSTVVDDGHAHSQSSSGTCCSSSHTSIDEFWLNGHLGDAHDPERGPPNLERVVLIIDGLQCGCCEGGISRTVARIPAIRNHQVNVVLARLEFELDTNRLSVLDVIKRLNAKTGYTFSEHVAPSGQVLELLVTSVAKLEDAGRPFGVTRIERPEKQPWHQAMLCSGRATPAPSGSDVAQSVRVHYQAADIGARDVFEYYQKCNQNLRLAPPTTHMSLAMGAKQTRQALLYFLPALILTLPVIVLAWAPLDHDKLVYAHVSLILATLVQMIAIKEFVPTALRSLWHAGVFEMDFLIALSSTIAYTFSVISYVFQVKKKPLETGSFFETSTLLVTLILLGRVINEFARYRAAKSVSFRSLQADEALLVLPNSPNLADPKTRNIDARLLQYGDHFKVAPHARVVTDGTILFGSSEIDESMITGESIPVAKGVHSKVFAGTMNGNGALVAQLTALPHENSVHKIAAMVEDAELTKPKAQALADKIAGWFVPFMATIGLIVFLAWLLITRFLTKRPWKNATVQAITYAIATLVVSCPCAIGLAVPMVVLIAGGVAARFGIVVRDPRKLETLRNVTDIVFDKTGTLTCGVMAVVGEEFMDMYPVQVKGILLSLLKDVRHPVAAAVLRHLETDATLNSENIIEPTIVVGITSVPGLGVYGTCVENNLEIRAGSPEWLDVDVEESTYTLLCVTIGQRPCAIFKLKDRLRHTADMVIEKLHAQGIETHMISGDGPGAVGDVAHSLNILKRNTKSRCKPEGKMNYVKDLQTPRKVVMFVGDGTNDSVALKQADIGVHINQGSDVAKSAADVVLMTARLHDVLILLDIARAAYRRIVLNFLWSALYNISAILLAAGVFTKVMKNARINPEYAGLGELVSVLPVVLIAFQMRWRDYGRRYSAIEYDYSRVDALSQHQLVRTRSTRTSCASDEARGWFCPPRSRKRVPEEQVDVKSSVVKPPSEQDLADVAKVEMPQTHGTVTSPSVDGARCLPNSLGEHREVHDIQGVNEDEDVTAEG